MKSASAFFIARTRKTLPAPEIISKAYSTVGNSRKSMILQGYTLCEVDKGKTAQGLGTSDPVKPVAQMAPSLGSSGLYVIPGLCAMGGTRLVLSESFESRMPIGLQPDSPFNKCVAELTEAKPGFAGVGQGGAK